MTHTAWWLALGADVVHQEFLGGTCSYAWRRLEVKTKGVVAGETSVCEILACETVSTAVITGPIDIIVDHLQSRTSSHTLVGSPQQIIASNAANTYIIIQAGITRWHTCRTFAIGSILVVINRAVNNTSRCYSIQVIQRRCCIADSACCRRCWALLTVCIARNATVCGTVLVLPSIASWNTCGIGCVEHVVQG